MLTKKSKLKVFQWLVDTKVTPSIKGLESIDDESSDGEEKLSFSLTPSTITSTAEELLASYDDGDVGIRALAFLINQWCERHKFSPPFDKKEFNIK